ncbi:MAG: bifunctional oligoribonuclease/PAP phosphatase NrnA [Candidatus Bathyarchaeia archaeon]
MQIQDIEFIINKVEAKSILLLCHQNADPDAICSSYAFSQMLKRLHPQMNVVIASPKGISRLSKFLSEYFVMDITEKEPQFKNFDVIIMFDTNTIQQLGDWSIYLKKISVPFIVIDHHASHPETEKIATLCISDENSSSTCEIIYSFFKELNIKPSRKEAEALFLGIAFDTKHFTLANSSTFKIIAELTEAGFNTREALSMMSLSMDISERIARLKSCQRLRLMRINNWLVVFSHTSSYQASAARALVEMGAHLALVGGQRNDQIQISIRSSQDFYKQTDFHMGRDLAKPLGEYLHGMGGGHSTSAGINGIGDFEAAIKKATKIIREKLRKTSLIQ